MAKKKNKRNASNNEITFKRTYDSKNGKIYTTGMWIPNQKKSVIITKLPKGVTQVITKKIMGKSNSQMYMRKMFNPYN